MTFHMKSIIFETEKTLYRWYIMLKSECLCIIYDTVWNFITFLKRMKIFETEKTLYLWYIMHWRHLLVFQWYNAVIYENWIFMTFLRKIKYLRNRRNLCIFNEYLFNFPTWTLLNSYVWFSMTFLKETGFPLKPRKLSLNSYVFFTWVICWHVFSIIFCGP